MQRIEKKETKRVKSNSEEFSDDDEDVGKYQEIIFIHLHQS